MDVYGKNLPGTALWVISINWKDYRNDELRDQFRKMLPSLRPPDFPEPKPAGRGGRSAGARALDMLRQLPGVAASRQPRAGGFNPVGIGGEGILALGPAPVRMSNPFACLARMGISESQRDSIIQPRVARHELPWVIAQTNHQP
jgi:hypothetical protein